MPPKPSNQLQSSVSSSSEVEDEEVESGNEGEKQVEKQGEKGKKEEEEQQESSSSEEEEEDSSSGDDEEEEKLPTKPKTQVSLQKPIPNTQTSQKPGNHLISKDVQKSGVLLKKIPPKPSNQPQSSVSSFSSEDESDTIREEQVEGKKQAISSKPVAAASTVVKRSLEINKESKQKKKKVADVEEKGKKLIKRVFSANDEIVVLKGLVDLKKNGISINSNNNMNDLFDLVKGLLGFEANVNQLNNKVQRLHQKFHNNAKRAKQPGEIPKISNPHELESFKLSNEIWGDEIGKNGALEDNQSGMALRKKKKMLVSQAISPMADLTEEENNVIGCQYQYLNQSLKPQNYLALPVPPACLGEIAAKNGWEMFGSSKARAFDQKWKSLIIKETEAYLERVALVQEQTQWMLDVHNSSDS